MGVCVNKDRQLIPAAALLQEATVSPSIIIDSERHADIQNHYQFVRLIGQGQYGTVREAKKKGSGILVAIKSVSKEKIQEDLYLLRREFDILRIIDHPNLVGYYESYEDAKYLHIVMELCTGGDLFEKLATLGAMGEAEVAGIMVKLLPAVKYLHGLGICHRDLKPENLLFVTKEPNAELKIIDFGTSIKTRDNRLMTTMVGTPYYLAPEMLLGNYGKECDVWSLGVIMYLMLSVTQPFEGEDMREIFYNISQAKVSFKGSEWKKVSESAKDLMRKMMTALPTKRISLADALRHQWFEEQKERVPQAPVSCAVFDSLKRFKAPKKLQQEAMKVMVKFMSAEDIADLRSAFLQMDTGKTGFLTPRDLEQAMRRAGYDVPAHELSSTAHTEIIASLDRLTLGKIKYSDFLVAALDKKRLLDQELLFLTFQYFDIDNDGFINVRDLRSAIDNLTGVDSTIPDIEGMIADWDLDNNRQIDFEEFKRMMEDSKRYLVPEEQQPDLPSGRTTSRRATVRRTIGKLVQPET